MFRKDPTPAEVVEATSDPYEDWDPAPLAEPVPPALTGQNVLETPRPAIMRDVPRDRVPGGQNDRGAQPEPTGQIDRSKGDR